MNFTIKTLFGAGALLIGGLATAQTASVQIIHNSADAAAEVVDIYAGSDLLIDDFEFRTATPFQDLPAGVSIDIGIAPSGSTSSADAIATIPVSFVAGETYVVVANGLISPTGYSPNAATVPFNLFATDVGRESASMMGNTDVLVFHGATDAPTVDVQANGAGTLIDDLDYATFDADYLELPTDDYTINIADASGSTVVRSYQAPLETLGLEDAALVVLASGFLDPSMNSDGADFGLWVALPAGGDLVELPSSEATLQVIHNSADLAASEVDVYFNGGLLLDNFAFRTATSFVDVPAEVQNEIAIAPSSSTSVADALVTVPITFSANESYVAIANGMVSASGYSPLQPFSLDVFDMGQEEAAMAGNTDVLVFHGSTDAPTVDVDAAGAGNLIDDVSYGEFAASYLELATADYIIEIKDSPGTSLLFSYSAPLSSLMLDDAAIVVVASGFADPSANSDGAGFGLWVALPAGGDMVELPTAFANIDEKANFDFSVFPNPTTDNIQFTGLNETANIIITDINGKVLVNQLVNPNETISVEDFDAGMYLVQLTIDGEKVTKKLTVR